MKLFIAKTTDKFKFRIKFVKGDDYWRNSIWLDHWWFGKYYFYILFF